eukprot:CAMPEP_0203659378 /NCGR_PEP_ID=MMETSP0088-20131115/51750_1 /ASSEMBLY_ACC=CAM_ASM_001087 /TAXON_ID=426623 /ORGANISM="Chaetoceros affinis, Strain CCMP159" /LENGTH=39 /DNA_ID= /DNA_START= /DNA_END= /DNA_ORIENTATION=
MKSTSSTLNVYTTGFKVKRPMDLIAHFSSSLRPIALAGT